MFRNSIPFRSMASEKLSGSSRFRRRTSVTSIVALSLLSLSTIGSRVEAQSPLFWDTGGGSLFWDVRQNWSPDVLPTSTHDVNILFAAGSSITHTIHRQGTTAIRSLNTNGQVRITGGFLTILNEVTFNGAGGIRLDGGGLSARLVQHQQLQFSTSSNNYLSNVTIAGSPYGLNVGTGSEAGSVRLANPLIFEGPLVSSISYNVGTGTAASQSALRLDGNQTLDGAIVNLGGFNSGGRLGSGISGAAQTLTLGSNLIVQGSGTVGGLPNISFVPETTNPNASLVNNGIIRATMANSGIGISAAGTGTVTNNGQITTSTTGSSLAFNSSRLINNGTVSVDNGGILNLSLFTNGALSQLGDMSINGVNSLVRINGTYNSNQFMPQSVGGFRVTGGASVEFIGGTLNNTGGTFDFAGLGADSARGNVKLDAVSIVGGTLANTHLARFNGTIFDNVTLAGTTGLNLFAPSRQIGQSVRIRNGIQYGAGTIFTVSGASSLYVLGNQTLDNATVKLSGSTFGYDPTGPALQTLTLGSNFRVENTAGTSQVGGSSLINQGVISALGNVNGSSLTVKTTQKPLTNFGLMQATGGLSQLTIDTGGDNWFTNHGQVAAANGGTVVISSNASKLGNLLATGAGSLIRIQPFPTLNTTSDQLSGLRAEDGGTIRLVNGTIDNTGRTLNLVDVVSMTGNRGFLELDQVTINGGGIISSDRLSFTAASGSPTRWTVLNGVTLLGNTGLNVGGSVRFMNGSSFGGGSVFNVGVGLGTGYLLFDGNQTVDNAIINLGPLRNNFPGNGVLASSGTGTQTLTLGSNLLVTGAGTIGGVFGNSGTANLVNNGTIIANLSHPSAPFVTADLAVQATPGGTVTNNGTMAASVNGARLNVGNGSRVINNGVIQVMATGATVALIGSANENNGRIEAINGGKVIVNNGLTNRNQLQVAANSTFDIQTGSLTQTDGNTNVDGVLSLVGGQTLQLQGGTLTGSGRIVRSNTTGTLLVNNTGGVVSPGNSPGTLTIGGNYTQGAGGTLLIEIGGIGASQYDVLNITGMAALNGTLALDFVNGFIPEPGQTFQFLSAAGGITGGFSMFSSLTPGISYSFLGSGGSGTITVNSVSAAAPEPGTIALLMVGGLFFSAVPSWRRSRQG